MEFFLHANILFISILFISVSFFLFSLILQISFLLGDTRKFMHTNNFLPGQGESRTAYEDGELATTQQQQQS